MTRLNAKFLGLVLLWGGLLLPAAAGAGSIVTQASGAAPADIQASVDAFRAAAGNPNNGNAAGLQSGRREINWDGGGATTPTNSTTPFIGFLNTRGVNLQTPGSGFIQGAPDALATEFSRPSFATTFEAFSASRLFTPIGSNVTDVTFFVPGSSGATPATVGAFGSVFSDVDLNATSLEFFDSANASLGTFLAPSVAGAATLSFLGVFFDAGERVARVRITTGNTALGVFDDSPIYDVTVMDDFIFSEPVPEPGALALVSLGLAGLGLAGRRRRSRS